MKRVSTYSLALALALGGGMLAMSGTAQAMQQSTEVVEFDQHNLSEAVIQSGGAAQALIRGEEAIDVAAVRGMLETARAAIANDDDRYFIGQLMLELGVRMQNEGAETAAIREVQQPGLELALESNRLGLPQRAVYWRFLGNMIGEGPEATAAYGNALQYDPDDVESGVELARVIFDSGDTATGFETVDRALEAAGRTGLETQRRWLIIPLNAAKDARMPDRAAQYGAALIMLEPSNDSWSRALAAYLDSGRFDDPMYLDLFRLMHDVGVLNASGFRDYARLANFPSGLPQESISIFDEGIASGALTRPDDYAEIKAAADREPSEFDSLESDARAAANGARALTFADALVSYGRYDRAIAMYRLALEKGGVDAGMVNLRLGRALIGAGRNEEARQAFAATTGQRAGLARFWQVWLDQQSDGGTNSAPEPAAAPDEAEQPSG